MYIDDAYLFRFSAGARHRIVVAPVDNLAGGARITVVAIPTTLSFLGYSRLPSAILSWRRACPLPCPVL